MEFNETWDMGRLVDLGGPLYNGMWKINDPLFPPFRLEELDMSQWCKDQGQDPPIYTQTMSMCVQCSTYLETGAHMYPDMEDVSEVGLERLFLSAVVLHVDVGPGEHVRREHLEAELSRQGDSIRSGEAIIIASGYNHFDESTKPGTSPHFSYDAFKWMLAHQPAVIGSDIAAWYDGKEHPGFFPEFLASGALLLAPMVNLRAVDVPRINLIIMPLRIRGACASPCRVIGVLPASA